MFFLATTDGTAVNLHLQEILASMQNIERQLQPISIVVGFVLLVFGTMRGFLEADSRKFMLNLLRAIIIVCLIGHWFQVKQWLSYAADGLTQYRVDVNLAAVGQGSRQVAVGENVDEIRSIIAEKVTQKSDGQSQLGGSDLFNPIQAAQKLFNANVSHLLSAVLWHIYLGTLFICEWIMVMVSFLQQAIVVFLDLYVPIALAEFSVRGLQSQGEAFFKNYIGVHAWPVGWVFANLVTLALLQALSAPHSENPVEILGAIVWSVPILLWVIIGHVIGPFYAQKVVARGGAELQAFAGAMIAAVGGTTGAAYAGALRFGAREFRGLGESALYPRGNSEARGSGGQESSTNWASMPDFMGASASGGVNVRPGRGVGDWMRRFAGAGIELGARANDITAGASETGGSLASTMGSMIANASGYRLGPEGNFRIGSFRKSELNRSSQRARNYLN
jgi:opacity protein-like surface antigen